MSEARVSDGARSVALQVERTATESDLAATVQEHLRGARTAVAGLGSTEATIAEASLQLEDTADRTRAMARHYRQARSREKLEAVEERREAAAWKLGSSIANAAGSIGASLIGGDYGKLASAAGEAIGAGLGYGGEMRSQDAATSDLQASELEEMASDLSKDVEDADKGADKLMSGADALARARAENGMVPLRG